jgi:uncharacterized tellurite resistance protein B-like protein
MGLLKLLGIKRDELAGRDLLGTLFDGIEGIVGERPVEEIKLITGYAGLLGRVANADLTITDGEVGRMRGILLDVLGLDADEVEAIVEILLRHRVQLLNLEDHVYARLINDVTDRPHKLKLLRALYEVAAADGSVREREDQEIRVITRALMLSHGDFIAARREFREQLAVLQKSPGRE